MRRSVAAVAVATVLTTGGCARTFVGHASSVSTGATPGTTSSGRTPDPRIVTFNARAVERGVTEILTSPSPTGYGIDDVSEVDCPADQPATRNTVFKCSVVVSGETKKVAITVTSDDGDYTVGLPR